MPCGIPVQFLNLYPGSAVAITSFPLIVNLFPFSTITVSFATCSTLSGATLPIVVLFDFTVTVYSCGCGCGGWSCTKIALTSTSSSGIINVVVVEFALSGSTFTPSLVVTSHLSNLYPLTLLGVASNIISVPAISAVVSTPPTFPTFANAVPYSGLFGFTSIWYNFPKIAFIVTSLSGIINAVFSAPSSKWTWPLFPGTPFNTCHFLNLNPLFAAAFIVTVVPGLACLISSVLPSKVAVPCPSFSIVTVYSVGCCGCSSGILTSTFSLL